ncbi:pyocin knob domain-containing protein [Providencia rettgeri]|uniref:pyocin knob domain-containing protein n=1 Tax=Providencia rettgeri TaxID=587 RepID=UPI003D274BF3
MIYEIGTISTKANDPRITGKSTLWKNSVTKVSVGQIILIQSGNTIYQNSIRSVESDTQMTLSFPVPVALTDVKYVISITMIGSVSDGVNKATAMVTESYQLMMILNRLMTESGVIKVVLPDGTEMQLRTEKERDRLLDGKFDKAGGTLSNHLSVIGRVYTRSNATTNANEISIDALNTSGNCINSKRGTDPVTTHYLPTTTGTLMQVGDYGIGVVNGMQIPNYDYNDIQTNGFYGGPGSIEAKNPPPQTTGGNPVYGAAIMVSRSSNEAFLIVAHRSEIVYRYKSSGVWSDSYLRFYTTANTTKDSNGNLKAASPVVKLFADDIELNDESEGVEMEHLGVGHYLIKGVVGFNADGAWGINNGFVIPQDHNGKNMVLIDYEVRPDGDIEVFVFHQQNADMPERFQNKRIKHFDEEGVPVYFENYEPCDVPESRWIDMRVEMPPNSLYNQKQAEAERVAKLEAERLAQEEAERAEQEATEREQNETIEN